jgi:hypothetical protein
MFSIFSQFLIPYAPKMECGDKILLLQIILSISSFIQDGWEVPLG